MKNLILNSFVLYLSEFGIDRNKYILENKKQQYSTNMMQRYPKKQKRIIIILITLALNVIYCSVAFPQRFKPEGTTFVRDLGTHEEGVQPT